MDRDVRWRGKVKKSKSGDSFLSANSKFLYISPLVSVYGFRVAFLSSMVDRV